MANYDSGVTYDSGELYDAVVLATPPKRMAKSKLNLKDKSDSELGDFTQSHITAMTGNANFTTPNPAATPFATLLTNYNTALGASLAAQQAAVAATNAKDTARTALEAGLNQRASYVDSTSGGDEAKILSAGFQVREPAVPVGPLPAPVDFLATMGDLEGEIDLTWSRVRGAKSYVVQHSENVSPRVWSQKAIAPKSKVTITGCTPGAICVFRVAAIGAAGQGPWSDESVKMSP